MKRRDFIAGLTGVTFAPGIPEGLARTEINLPVMKIENASLQNKIEEENVRYEWGHSEERMHSRLQAPTEGWIAVGFNSQRKLKGTRFVIAETSSFPVRVEEHIALVPDHQKVQDLDLLKTVDDVSGSYENGTSKLCFSLPHLFSDQPGLILTPNTQIYIMLAWSLAGEFNHHSAWRRHYVRSA